MKLLQTFQLDLNTSVCFIVTPVQYLEHQRKEMKKVCSIEYAIIVSSSLSAPTSRILYITLSNFLVRIFGKLISFIYKYHKCHNCHSHYFSTNPLKEECSSQNYYNHSSVLELETPTAFPKRKFIEQVLLYLLITARSDCPWRGHSSNPKNFMLCLLSTSITLVLISFFPQIAWFPCM